MTVELRQWAIEKAIAAGTDCFAVMAIAAQILTFVTHKPVEPAEPVALPKRFKKAVYEEAFDAGLTPKQTAAKIGCKRASAASNFTAIRRARGIPPSKRGNPNFGRTNGAAHS